MFTISVIGNLGADAKKVNENGAEFISFNVAHTDKFTDKSGKEVEQTEWISCTINGNRDNLLQYLTKGTKVYCTGRAQTRLYSSPKLKRMVAGVRCFVDRIELVGGLTDSVPHHLVTPDGELVDVFKYFQVDPKIAKKLGATSKNDAYIYTERGTAFLVNKDGWVRPQELMAQGNEAEGNESNSENI